MAARGPLSGLVAEGEAGNVATVTVVDVVQSNGVIHVIDPVMLPAK